MATIELSSALYSAAATRIWRLEDNSSGTAAYNVSGLLPSGGGSNSEAVSAMYLYKGTAPVAWGTSPTTQTSNLLVKWSTGTDLGATKGPVTVGTTTTINTLYKAATGSGTASWFLLHVYNPVYGEGNYYQQIIGTVGITGSGADLELANTSVVTGRLYKITNLKITLPGSWTY